MSQEIDKERMTPPTLPTDAVPKPGHPTPTNNMVNEDYKIVNVLSVAFALVGVICIFGGLLLAVESYSFNWAFCIAGIISMMFCFGCAVVMRVCSLYMKTHDKL